MCAYCKVAGYIVEVRFYIVICMSVEGGLTVRHLQCLCFYQWVSGNWCRIIKKHLHFSSNSE